MRKLLWGMTAMVALAAPGALTAQGSQTATINVYARVQSAVTFSNQTDLDFGAAITPGMGATVAPANGGKVMVSYNTPTTVTVAGTSLSRTGGGTLAVTYACAQASTGTATSPTPFPSTCAAGYTTALTNSARTDHWIYVGGDIAASETTSAAAGTYNGTVTFTATYTTY